MLGMSLYSYSYLNQEKCFIFLIIAYIYSSTKLEIRAEQVLPGSEGDGGKGRVWREGGRNCPMYSHVSK
jgi:hypothetical protein